MATEHFERLLVNIDETYCETGLYACKHTHGMSEIQM